MEAIIVKRYGLSGEIIFDGIVLGSDFQTKTVGQIGDVPDHVVPLLNVPVQKQAKLFWHVE